MLRILRILTKIPMKISMKILMKVLMKIFFLSKLGKILMLKDG